MSQTATLLAKPVGALPRFGLAAGGEVNFDTSALRVTKPQAEPSVDFEALARKAQGAVDQLTQSNETTLDLSSSSVAPIVRDLRSNQIIDGQQVDLTDDTQAEFKLGSDGSRKITFYKCDDSTAVTDMHMPQGRRNNSPRSSLQKEEFASLKLSNNPRGQKLQVERNTKDGFERKAFFIAV